MSETFNLLGTMYTEQLWHTDKPVAEPL